MSYKYINVSTKLLLLANDMLSVIYAFVVTGLYISELLVNLSIDELLSRVMLYSNIKPVNILDCVDPKVILLFSNSCNILLIN